MLTIKKHAATTTVALNVKQQTVQAGLATVKATISNKNITGLPFYLLPNVDSDDNRIALTNALEAINPHLKPALMIQDLYYHGLNYTGFLIPDQPAKITLIISFVPAEATVNLIATQNRN